MRIFLIGIAIVGSLLIPAAQADASALMEGWNITSTVDVNVWGGPQIAWKYTSSQSYYLSRIEFYTYGLDRDDMVIQLRADNSGEVGSILSSGTYDQISAPGWQGADITTYEVIAGQSYWVSIGNSDRLRGMITLDEGTVEIPERWGYTPDDYSHLYIGNKPMAKFYSSPIPEPATMVLFSIGGLATALIKRRRKTW